MCAIEIAHIYFISSVFFAIKGSMSFANRKTEVGAVKEKLRKACVLDWKCSKKSYVMARISTSAPTQNL